MSIYCFILLLIPYLNGAFTPDVNNYESYGLKMAMNDILFVQVQNENNPPTFLIQFSLYNSTRSSLKCSIHYPNTIDHYVYTVAIGKNQIDFFFAGELINGKNGTFIGVAKFNSSSSTCETSFTCFLQYFYNYEHQEYYILDVQPNGHLAYGFSNQFIFIFDSQNTSALDLWDGNLTWPNDSFMPHTVDLTDNFGIIAGFIHNPISTATIYVPMIYLINFNSSNNHPIIIDQYQPTPTPSMWQDLLTNSDANMYSAKYDMSVSINELGNTLVGMQFINRVFLFSVNRTNPKKLIYTNRNTNGRSIGNGKSVAWLENGIAAVLINTYSLNYRWVSSEIYFYDIQTDGYNSSTTPLSVFPNNHQVLPLSFKPIFINIISSPSSLALSDNQGNILIFNPTSPGFYPSVPESGSTPMFTSPKPCLPGSYKSQRGIHDCLLCPTGTKNPGNSSIQCISCLTESFCPLGSVSDIPRSKLESIIQAIAYPKSPENTVFDEVLIRNTFHMDLCRSLLVSPLFWALVVLGIATTVIFIMCVLKKSPKQSRRRRSREHFKFLFLRIDLIGGGELWVGGLASFSVIVLVGFTYAFSNRFLNQYPIEKSSGFYLACDSSLRNAKFETNLQSLSTPVTETEQKMFDLLNNQTFVLNIDFVNTLINCDAISIQALIGTKWCIIRWSNCVNINYILSLSIPLPYQHITVQVLLDDVKTIGALRLGLYSNGFENERFNLKELNFFQSFYKYGQILAQTLPIYLDITKVINETLPMTGTESDFSAIYIPTFEDDLNCLFLSNDQYVRSTLSLTTLTISLSETPYYVKNLQQPIAKRAEVIFHTLLFTIVYLDIFGLLLIFYELTKPLRDLLRSKYYTMTHNNKKKKNKRKKNGPDISVISNS